MKFNLRTALQVIVGAACLLLGQWVYAIDTASFDDPVLQARYLKLTNELRCLQCQNESIADSNASLAADLRREVREMLSAGKTDDEILKFLTDRYGDFVLYKPPVASRTLFIWAAPAVFLLGALATVVVVVQRRAKQPQDTSDSPGDEEIK